MALRICIISEAIESPFDEGVKIFVYNLIKELSKVHEIVGIGRSGRVEGEIEKFCVKAIPQNRYFVSRKLRLEIRRFAPDIIFYIPTACATLPSFVRARVLKWYGRGCRTILISLQPRRHSTVVKRIMALFAPDLILAQSSRSRKYLNDLGCKARTIPAGVDLERFVPVTREVREVLRRKHGIPIDKYVVLHVGHINQNRNTQFMAEIQGMDNGQGVVVGSTTYHADSSLIDELHEAGVIVIDKYVKEIEEIYQCADCYLFPVHSEGACIEIPLSVMEALACDVPVVSTRFGGLEDILGEEGGLFYADTMAGLKTKIALARSTFCDAGAGTRNLVKKFTWANIATQILNEAGCGAKMKQ